MEFHEKLQQLRKQNELTQEALAQALFVSRTAISKWESGRGFPSIASLQAIAAFFSVSVDSLLSADQLLSIAQAEGKQERGRIRDLIFGLLDIACVLFLVLPLFGVRGDGQAQAVSLVGLSGVSPYLIAAFYAVVGAGAVWGVLLLALQNLDAVQWRRICYWVSVGINATALLLFIVSLQPYAAVLSLLFLFIKVVLAMKKP